MFDLGLADRLRAAGLRVIETNDWTTRGSSSFTPRGAVNHHTAGPPTGSAPSLGVVIDGRPDLAGPLCNVLQSREPDGQDVAYVIAAGRANHAGEGDWHGLSGNSSVWGLEIEHDGVTDLPVHRQEIAARIQAAMIAGTADAGMVCQHSEWTSRKIDAATNVDPDQFRASVAAYLAAEAPPAPGGALVSALAVQWPTWKTGAQPNGRYCFYTHDDTRLIGWNGAAVAGDRADGGSDQDSVDGMCPRVVDVPVTVGGRLVGICYTPADPTLVLAVDDRGGVFAYAAT